MAEDLKPMLTKVLASAGKKRFYFAYGLGKRKDGKGDGALFVDRKKLKPEAAEEDLEKAGQTFAGTCWSSPDGGTVFFAGKGKQLSQMVVAKMALTAKKEAGKQYDFQLPSPEEEARIDGLADEEANGAPAAPATGKPADDGSEAKFKARLVEVKQRFDQLKAADPARAQPLAGLLMQAASLGQVKQFTDAQLRLDECDKQLAALETPAADSAESAYLARVKALTEGLKKALTSGTPAGQEAKLRFSESQLFSRKKDFVQANTLLDVVEAQIEQALAAAPAPGANGPAQAPAAGKGAEPKAQAPAGDDPATEWKAKLAEWTPAIKAALAAKGPDAAAIAKLLAQATALAKPGGIMAEALAKLTECHALATAGPKTDSDPAAEFKKKLAEWTPAIKAALATKGPDAAAIAKLLAQASALSKPGGDMAQALEKLTECHDLATAAGASPKPKEEPAPAAATAAEPEEPAADEPEEGDPFERILGEVGAAIGRLSGTNPFGAGLNQRLKNLQGAAGQPTADSELIDLREDTAAAVAFEDQLRLVHDLIAPLGGYPVGTQLLYSWNAEQASARRAAPPIRVYVTEALKRLAVLERQARAALPPGAAAAADAAGEARAALRQLVARADAVHAEIEAIEDDGTRGELLAQHRQLQQLIPAAEGLTAGARAEAEKLIADLEQKVKAAAQAEPEAAAETEAAAAAAEPAEGAAPPEAEPKDPTARWEAARAKVMADLQDVIRAVVASEDPDAGKAELELKAVRKQLSGTVTTRQEATEMERFLRDDNVVADISAMAYDLKTPLLEVLAEITPQLSA